MFFECKSCQSSRKLSDKKTTTYMLQIWYEGTEIMIETRWQNNKNRYKNLLNPRKFTNNFRKSVKIVTT